MLSLKNGYEYTAVYFYEPFWENRWSYVQGVYKKPL